MVYDISSPYNCVVFHPLIYPKQLWVVSLLNWEILIGQKVKHREVTPPKFNSSPLKAMMVGRRSFPIGKVTFRGELLNFGRVYLPAN